MPAQSPTPAAPPSPVPLFELATQWQSIQNDVERAVKEVFDTQQYTSGAASGPFIGRFEEHLGKFLNAHVVALSSGTDAILAALMALNIGRPHDGPPDEVITTPFTFFATAGCIVRSGARPVFVDIDPATFLLDINQIPAAVTDRTRAIVPVHLYGQMLDTDALRAVATSKSGQPLAIIEDAAQSIGARDPHDHPIAANATCACLSFYPTKNLGAAGDAGALVTRDPALATRFRQTRQHGETTRYHHDFVGGNFRMDAIQAAVLTVKLKHLDHWNNRRRAIAAFYTSRFQNAFVTPPAELPGTHHVYHQYVIRVPNGRRDALKDHLAKLGVGSNIFYPKSLHLQECFANLAYKKGDFPHAEKATEEVLALPIFPELTDAQIETVANAILSFPG